MPAKSRWDLIQRLKG